MTEEEKQDIYGTDETHPSYGMVSIHHVTGNINLFGSSFTHNSYLHLEVKHGVINRHLNQDWYRGKQSIIRIAISPAQFTEMISHMNHGDGVPCTLEYIEGKRIDPCPPSKQNKSQIHAEFEKEMRLLAKKLDSLIETAKQFETKKTLSKTEKHEFTRAVESVKQEIQSNFPFIHAQFNEAMEKTVVEVKSEIESGVATVLRNAGLEKIKEMIQGSDKQITL